MKVAELVAQLSQLPQDADLGIHYDGCDRMNLDAVWLARSGRVIVGSLIQAPVYDLEDRTVDSVQHDSDRYLQVHEMLGVPEPSEK
jgi:hypothetical protein